MAYLLDTSVLVRLANVNDTHYLAAAAAVQQLSHRGETLQITSQNAVEFRNVATRPTAVNGLGYSPKDADEQLAEFERLFPLLPETPAIHPAWRSLVSAAGVIGKQVHDARLAAVCQVHAVTHLLTFNVRHFARFAPFVPTLTVVDPGSV